MSAIAGIYHRDDHPTDRSELARMLDCVLRRGPDGEGVWHEGNVGLAHRMLRTTVESLDEIQPLTSENGALVLTADARVDNREELKADLDAHGIRLRSDTDAELILRAYERWGAECPIHILGDFAFAIWDARRRQLLCARDPFGVKPFHYYLDDRRFVWASEPRQILVDPTIPLEPNARSIGLILLQRGIEPEDSLYAGIRRLPPAHVVIVDRAGVRWSRYWDLDPADEIRYRTKAEYADQFRALFTDAVRSRLRACGPIAAFLSGGLDSSSIVCVAQELYREGRAPDSGFQTYSILFDSLPCDERRYIDEVIRKYDLRAHFVTFARERTALDLNRAMEHPGVLYDPTTYACFPLLQAARDNGSRACLWGVGGDEVLTAGPSYLATLLRHGRLGPLMVQLRYTASVCGCPTWRLIWPCCVKPLIPEAVRAPLRPIARRLRGDGLPPWITATFIQTAGLSAPGAETVNKKFRSASQRQLYAALVSAPQADMLLGHLDAMGSANSIEVRHPFLDRRLVEFAMRVPDEHKIGAGQTKALLRNAVRHALPEAVVGRLGKAVFTHANDWELRHGQATAVEHLLKESKLAGMDILDRGQLMTMLGRYRSNSSRRDLATVRRDCSAIWTVVRLELWLKTLSALQKERETHGTVAQAR